MTIAARKPPPTVLAGVLLVLAGVFAALGYWQVERRAWKHGLIAAVDHRINTDPVAAPGPQEWKDLTAGRDAYRRVTVTGHFLQGRDTLIRAVSDLGSGYWVMTPIDTGSFAVLVNCGFILPGQRSADRRLPSGIVVVTGLLRISEPGGGFLRRNDPAAGRWYSRDVPAIAQARGLRRTAPYFVDADAAANAPGGPVGGLTVVRFADNHAVYALTWCAMSLLSLWAARQVLRERWGAKPAPA